MESSDINKNNGESDEPDRDQMKDLVPERLLILAMTAEKIHNIQKLRKQLKRQEKMLKLLIDPLLKDEPPYPPRLDLLKSNAPAGPGSTGWMKMLVDVMSKSPCEFS